MHRNNSFFASGTNGPKTLSRKDREIRKFRNKYEDQSKCFDEVKVSSGYKKYQEKLKLREKQKIREGRSPPRRTSPGSSKRYLPGDHALRRHKRSRSKSPRRSPRGVNNRKDYQRWDDPLTYPERRTNDRRPKSLYRSDGYKPSRVPEDSPERCHKRYRPITSREGTEFRSSPFRDVSVAGSFELSPPLSPNLVIDVPMRPSHEFDDPPGLNRRNSDMFPPYERSYNRPEEIRYPMPNSPQDRPLLGQGYRFKRGSKSSPEVEYDRERIRYLRADNSCRLLSPEKSFSPRPERRMSSTNPQSHPWIPSNYSEKDVSFSSASERGSIGSHDRFRSPLRLLSPQITQLARDLRRSQSPKLEYRESSFDQYPWYRESDQKRFGSISPASSVYQSPARQIFVTVSRDNMHLSPTSIHPRSSTSAIRLDHNLRSRSPQNEGPHYHHRPPRASLEERLDVDSLQFDEYHTNEWSKTENNYRKNSPLRLKATNRRADPDTRNIYEDRPTHLRRGRESNRKKDSVKMRLRSISLSPEHPNAAANSSRRQPHHKHLKSHLSSRTRTNSSLSLSSSRESMEPEKLLRSESNAFPLSSAHSGNVVVAPISTPPPPFIGSLHSDLPQSTASNLEPMVSLPTQVYENEKNQVSFHDHDYRIKPPQSTPMNTTIPPLSEFSGNIPISQMSSTYCVSGQSTGWAMPGVGLPSAYLGSVQSVGQFPNVNNIFPGKIPYVQQSSLVVSEQFVGEPVSEEVKRFSGSNAQVEMSSAYPVSGFTGADYGYSHNFVGHQNIRQKDMLGTHSEDLTERYSFPPPTGGGSQMFIASHPSIVQSSGLTTNIGLNVNYPGSAAPYGVSARHLMRFPEPGHVPAPPYAVSNDRLAGYNVPTEIRNNDDAPQINNKAIKQQNVKESTLNKSFNNTGQNSVSNGVRELLCCSVEHPKHGLPIDVCKSVISEINNRAALNSSVHIYKTFRKSGTMKWHCADQYTEDWIKDQISRFRCMRKLRYMIGAPNEIKPGTVRVRVFIRGVAPVMSDQQIINAFKEQCGFPVEKWQLLASKNEKSCKMLCLKIDMLSLEMLKKVDMRPFYMDQRVKFKVIDL